MRSWVAIGDEKGEWRREVKRRCRCRCSASTSTSMQISSDANADAERRYLRRWWRLASLCAKTHRCRRRSPLPLWCGPRSCLRFQTPRLDFGSDPVAAAFISSHARPPPRQERYRHRARRSGGT
ncbi:hypothetical protein BHE74_00054738 [Ensete ventricosum]|nr:hypothetical protein BHE74_00054738 [Ensete ventricosum]